MPARRALRKKGWCEVNNFVTCPVCKRKLQGVKLSLARPQLIDGQVHAMVFVDGEPQAVRLCQVAEPGDGEGPEDSWQSSVNVDEVVM
jgi:hypothetical protein